MKYRGLFIGLTTIDIQYFVEQFPEPNKKVKTKSPDILVGGPAANAAVAFAHLNNGAFFASAFGNNSFDAFVREDFEETRVQFTDLIGMQKKNPVLASVITSGQNGDRNIFTHSPDAISPELSP
ncbi:pfkB family carbohydrate kinase [Mariniphaga anaerophila]|uniref:PfkB family carbohydrate kinase n=1 Tax=Mariniphaga anaerophila TaxID=1484053 RepID=A0A1M4SYJ6_9BACT|nr:PfkB family carbohydrate kinase [Mariniphaga anaerophila]SHE37253.1 pfkB family carbohydrate kinase [Mariniphaga anaerophila]